jgi:uncharacterized protein
MTQMLLEHGADPDIKDTLINSPPIIYAAGNGGLEIIKLLLEYKADPNLTGYGGICALGGAASKGYLEVVKLLISNGAEVNNQNFLAVTPLMLAASSGHIEIVKLLIEKRADVNAISSHGYNALICAIYSKNLSLL